MILNEVSSHSHAITQIFQTMQGFDGSVAQIAFDVTQEYLQPILAKLSQLERDIVGASSGNSTSSSFYHTMAEDIMQIPVIKRRLAALETYAQQDFHTMKVQNQELTQDFYFS